MRDLAAVAARRGEPTVAHETLVRRLRADGLLSPPQEAGNPLGANLRSDQIRTRVRLMKLDIRAEDCRKSGKLHPTG